VRCIVALAHRLTRAENYVHLQFSTRDHVKSVYLRVVTSHIERQQQKERKAHAKVVARARADASPEPAPLAQEAIPTLLEKHELPRSVQTKGAYYYSWAYAPMHSIDMVSKGRLHPVAAVDGTHCTRVIEHGSGVFLLGYAQDNDKNQVLLLAVHVLGNESTATWEYFFKQMKIAYTNDEGVCMLLAQGFTFVADGMKGIDTAFHKHMNEDDDDDDDGDGDDAPPLFRACAHCKDNILHGFTDAHVKAYVHATEATTHHDLEARKEAYVTLPDSARFTEFMAPMQYALAEGKAQAFFFRCVNHRRENIKLQFGNAHASAYMFAVKSTTFAELRARKALFSKVPTKEDKSIDDFVAYMNKLDDHEQYPVAHAAHAKHSLRQQHTEQTCESMNAAHKAVRQMSPPHALLFFALEDMRRAIGVHAEATGATTSEFTILTSHLLQTYGTTSASACGQWRQLTTNSSLRSTLRITLGNGRAPYTYAPRGHHTDFQGTVQVARNAVRFGEACVRVASIATVEVDLLKKTCECGWWALHETPCAHAAGYAEKVGFSYPAIVAPHLLTKSWKEQWTGVLFGGSLAEAHAYQSGMCLPILETHGPAASGAPRKRTRIASVRSDYGNKKK